ncbi:MAG: hypothetical protein DCC51_06960 [Anaerolineae bacterium]|nr:MAG: hypothetical protein DCC51_06960 [Anaerolineae bacterium]
MTPRSRRPPPRRRQPRRAPKRPNSPAARPRPSALRMNTPTSPTTCGASSYWRRSCSPCSLS